MSAPVLPRYGQASLADLLTSVSAPLMGEPSGPIELPDARRYVVLLVDGLGLNVLRRYADHAEFLSGLLDGAQALTCGVPSTTATSITSLGTGAVPGEHGLVGYRFREPGTGCIMNALSWDGGPDDVAGFQPVPTWFERLDAADVGCATVSLARFAGSGLTRSALRGRRFVPVLGDGEFVERAELIAHTSRDASLVYAYERMLDHEGHGFGVGSWQWLDALAGVDDLATHLREALDDDTCLLITGDHGMINVDPDHHIVVEDHPELGGCDLIGGEARFRHLYTRDADAVAARWQEFLGDRAWVRTRDEAIRQGWFGPVAERVAPRIGDVVVAMRGEWAVLTHTHPVEFGLVGMHGSLTPDEMLVPLLVAP